MYGSSEHLLLTSTRTGPCGEDLMRKLCEPHLVFLTYLENRWASGRTCFQKPFTVGCSLELGSFDSPPIRLLQAVESYGNCKGASWETPHRQMQLYGIYNGRKRAVTSQLSGPCIYTEKLHGAFWGDSRVLRIRSPTACPLAYGNIHSFSQRVQVPNI